MIRKKLLKKIYNCYNTPLILFLILFLGFSLRFYNLSEESLWGDELATVKLSAQPLSYLLNPKINLPVDTYHLILHYCMRIFGQSEFSVRFPAMIFGVFSIFVIYLIGKRVFNREIGIFSSLILAISPFHIHYSQEARAYSLLMLLSLTSTYYFMKLIKSNDHKYIIVYTISTLIGIYTHYFIFFLLLFQNIYLIIYNLKKKKLVKRWLISQFIISLIFLLYHPYFLKHIAWATNGGFAYLIPYFSLVSIIKALYVFVSDYAFINSYYCVPCFYVNPLIIFLISVFFLFIILIGIQSLFSNKWNIRELIQKNDKLLFLLLYLTVPIIGLYAISLITPLYQVKYIIYSSTPLYILASLGISKFKNIMKLGITTIMLFLFSSVLFGYYIDVTKEQWRETSKFIDIHSKERDLVLSPYFTFVFDYYHVEIDKKRVVPDGYIYPKDENEIYGKPLKSSYINQSISNYNRIWLVLPPTWKLEDYDAITKEFKTLILEKRFKGVEIYLFEV
ncbi:MAG: glycosyltransferase family 39 protein [Nanoarchaeota archaeon]